MENYQPELGQKIGNLLKTARIQKRISVSRCADFLGTTRRRYVDIESGRSNLWVIELVRLCELLDLSPLTVFPHCTPQKVHRVMVCPGDMLEIVMDMDTQTK